MTTRPTLAALDQRPGKNRTGAAPGRGRDALAQGRKGSVSAGKRVKLAKSRLLEPALSSLYAP
jgi:hypothetical protein